MVTSCKNYITEFGTVGLWEQSSVLLIAKLKECCQLYQEYQKCYNKTKESAQTKLECKPFK